MLRKAIVAALLVFVSAPFVARAASPDTRDYQALLNQYLHRIAAKGEPFDTRFDYEQLYVDEKIWTLHRSERLERLHAELLAAEPSAMAPAERLAWAINTFNFLVIERATVHLLIPAKAFQRFKSVDQMSTSEGGFFEAKVAQVEGREYSLESFKRRFIYGDSTAAPAPRAPVSDPRLLFATNSGRIGAAPLMPRAFRADSLERQLDAVTRTALALPRFVTVTSNPPLLLVSDLFGRNVADFGGNVAGVFAFVHRYAPRAVNEAIRHGRFTDVSRYVEVNPLLNQMDRPKIVMPTPPAGDGAGS